MTTPSFSKTAISLHLLLWRRSMKGNPAAIFMQIFMLLFCVAGLFSTMVMMGFGIAEHSFSVFAGAISVGVTAYVIAAIMLPSGEGQIMPESFATLPVTAKETLPSFVMVQILQTRGVLALLCTIVTTVVSVAGFSAAGVSGIVVTLVVLANVLSFVATLVLAESLALMLNNTATEANRQNSKTILAVLAYMIGCIGFIVLFNNVNASANPIGQITQLGDIAKWTPFASAAGMAVFAAEGNWIGVLGCAAITVVTIGGGLYIWSNAIKRRLTAPLDSGRAGGQIRSSRGGAHSSILMSWLPYNPMSAVFSRTFYYGLRDSRMIMGIVMIPFMAIYFVVMSITMQQEMVLVAIPALTILAASSATNDYGQDGPSNWVHMTSGISAKDLVLARHWGGVVLTVLMAWLVNCGILIYLPEASTLIIFLLTIGLQLSTLALAVLLSVYNPFPTAKPGTNPWQDKSGYSSGAFVAILSGLFIGWIPVAPGALVALFGVTTGNVMLVIGGIVVAIAIPAVCYYFALRGAIRRVDQHYPEIFDKVRAFVS